MGRPPEGNELVPGQGGGYKSPSIRHLWPHHISMARMVACGASPQQIQLQTGFSSGQISRILGSPLFQAEVMRLSETIEEEAVYGVQEELKRMANRSIEILDEEVSKPATTLQERKVRNQVAFEILDRAGYGKTDKSVHKHLHAHAHFEKDAKKMSTEDLSNDVLDMIANDE